MSTTSIASPAPSVVAHPPAFREMFSEVFSLLDAVVVAGPPVILVAGPLVLGALLLIGPFALIVTAVLAIALALGLVAAVVALTGALVAAPFLVARRVGERRRTHGHRAVAAPRLATSQPRHAA